MAIGNILNLIKKTKPASVLHGAGFVVLKFKVIQKVVRFLIEKTIPSFKITARIDLFEWLRDFYPIEKR